MNQTSNYFIKAIAIASILFVSTVLASCFQAEVENNIANSININPRCNLEPFVDPDIEENEVLVIFELSTSSSKHNLIIWQDGERVYECRDVQGNALTGEGEFIRLPVKIDGELFRFEIKGIADNHETFMVPFPITYPESPENIVYLAGVNYYSDENGWQVGMRTEPVYYE